MLIRFPRTKPANVKSADFAIVMPEDNAADSDAIIGKPTFAALNTTSPDMRPLKAKKQSARSTSFRAAMPITLSTALCLPTSSANATSVPSACILPRHENRQFACSLLL